ncbi:MAG: hypothetical protein AMXMBFR33_55600 [Candidatus Xenobia bacterium]
MVDSNKVWPVEDIFHLSSGETVVAGRAPLNEHPQAEPGSRWQLLHDDILLVELEASHPRMPGQDKSVWTVSTTDPVQLSQDEQASLKAGRLKLRQASEPAAPSAGE